MECIHSDMAGSSVSYRLRTLDGLRFVMCLGIAALHFTSYFWHPTDIPLIYVKKLSYFTDIFFIISGFFWARTFAKAPFSITQYPTYLFLRWARIYPAYFVSLLFYILLAISVALGAVNVFNPDRYVLAHIVPHLLLIQSWGVEGSLSFNYPTWSLSGLWFCFIVVPFFLGKILKKTFLSILFILFLLVSGSFFSMVGCQAGTQITTLQFCDWGVLRALPSFVFGAFIANTSLFCRHSQEKQGDTKSFMLFLLVGFFILLFITPYHFTGMTRLLLLYGFITTLLWADRVSLKTPLSWKGFRFLSRYSYGVFLCHPIVATVFIRYVLPHAVDTDILYASAGGGLYKILFFVCALGVSVILAMASYHLIENPCYERAKLLANLWQKVRPVPLRKTESLSHPA